MSSRWMRLLFVVAGIYDGVLGIAFVLFPFNLFEWYDVPPPNHEGYVRFPALLLVLFGILFFQIATNPRKHRALILYGCGLKLAYCSTVFGYHVTEGVPSMWLPWAYADLVFLALFLWAWKSLGRATWSG